MTAGKRPGGLTALAVLNFVFSASAGLGALGLGVMVALHASGKQIEADDERSKHMLDAFAEFGLAPAIALIAIQLVVATLLMTSGIGYLTQRRFLGRTLGTVYAVLGITQVVAETWLMPTALTGGFTLASIVGLLYPAMTLVLLNGTFKEDFTASPR